MIVDNDKVDRLLDHFPGPLMIGVSITKYLLGLACAGIFVALGIWFVQSAATIAAALSTSHGVVRGEGILRFLILLRLASDIPQAVAELGWLSIVFFGVAALFGTVALMCGVTGVLGLSLDREGFTVKALKRNRRHSWADVGDFDSLILPRKARRPVFSNSCVVFNDYRASESPIKWLRQSGRNRVLIESYEYPADILAPAMSVWRERALQNRDSTSGAR